MKKVAVVTGESSEIERYTGYNIRSFVCRRHISPTKGGYHIEDISPVPQGTHIIEKSHLCQ